jgi:hypothetical protein
MVRTSHSTQTSESLRAVITEVEKITASLQVTAEEMDMYDMGEITISHYRSLVDGLRYLTKYTNAAREAVLEAREERGAFQSGGPCPPSQKRDTE